MNGRHGHGAAECREIFGRLSEYLDQELPDEVCSEIGGHLDDCPPCRRFLDSLRSTIGWIRSLEAPSMPDDVRRRVREAYARLRDELGGG